MQQEHGFDLTDRVAIVTGASRGIGAAIAQRLAAAGAKVVLSGRKQESLETMAAAIRQAGGDVLPVAAHTGDDAAIMALVERTTAVYGGVDILVNNAATNPHFGPILTAEESHWDKTFDINVKGYFRMVRACVPHLQLSRRGSVINVASIAGLKPQVGMGVYSVTKAAVLMLTEVLAAELAPLGIRVNAVAPGFVKTKFSSAIWDNPAVSDAVLRLIPQHRMAEPDELSGIVHYLASAAGSFTTGAVFTVDGGQMISPGLGE